MSQTTQVRGGAVREVLAGLTVRGRAFLAAGVTAFVCSVVLGQEDLSRVGILVALLPLVTALLVGRNRYRLALVRHVTPQLVTAGQQAHVRLELSNESRTPTGLLLLEDQVPYVLGTRPRFVIEGLRTGWKRHVTYQVRAELRGRYEIGPMAIRVSDPFGLVELGRAFQSTVTLTVTPRVVPLPPIAITGAWTGAGDNRPRAFATGSAEDVTVREYRRGDDLRRVHWRSSARVGELMVRREEQPWQSRATLFLDNRTRAHRGSGAASSLEAAVSAAASIAVHLTQRGFAVRLVTARGEDPSSRWHDRATDASPLLEALAVVRPMKMPHIDGSWLQDDTHAGLLVAVLGSVEGHDTPVLQRMQHHCASPLALALDVDAWVHGSPRAGADPGRLPGSSAAPWLAGHGWRAVAMGPRDQLANTWQEMGRSARTAAPSAPTGPQAAEGLP